MFVTKVNFLLFVFCDFFLNSRGLERLDLAEDDIILVTEAAIRNTTSKVFLGLKLNVRKFNKKLRQASLVHNFLTSVTLKDHKCLNEIVRLTRVDKNNVNNETQGLLIILNEILSEDWNDSDDNDFIPQNEDILRYVDEFLANLEEFKENSGISDNNDSLDIKDEIINILRTDTLGVFNVSNPNVTVAPKLDEDDGLLSDNEFWVPEKETRRIYRGNKVKIKYFPFMASIHIFSSFQCGGSIIKSDLIITAASCLQLAWNNRFFRENPAFLSIRVGSNFYFGGGESIPILEVYFHPEYNPKNLRNNIALLRLVRHLKFRRTKKRLRKIDIDRKDSSLPVNTDGITIIGWGARGSNNIVGDPWSNQLAFAVLDIYHIEECQQIYSKEYVTRTNFCAGFISKGGGACNHDVGDPGVVNGILTGVASFGSPVCGTPDAPTVFTKVGYYTDWIEEIMEQDVPLGKVRTTLKPPVIFLPQLPRHLETTTFKIVPLGKKPELEPIPISNIDTLRILEDEDLFKEFVNTMFESKEAQEYKNMFKDEFKTKPKAKKIKLIEINTPATSKVHLDLTRNQPEMQKIDRPEKEEYEPKSYRVTRYINEDSAIEEEPATEEELAIEDEPAIKKEPVIEKKPAIEEELAIENVHIGTRMDSLETVTKPQNKFTALDENLIIDDHIIEEQIVKLIDNIDVSDMEEETSVSESRELSLEVNYEQATEKPSESTETKDEKQKSDVLTLLYLSDGENSTAALDDIENVIEDFDENIDDGLAISVDGFNDLTFRNNKTNAASDLFSKSELYTLLSEAIINLGSNKTVKRFYDLFLEPCRY